MRFSRRWGIRAAAVDKMPIEEFDPPLNEEEKKLYEDDYKRARHMEELGLNPQEMKLEFSATWDWDDD